MIEEKLFIDKSKIREIAKDCVKEATKKLPKEIFGVYLFGSSFRGDYTPESDIDILFIVKQRNLRVRDEITEVTSNISLKYEVVISGIIEDLETWKKNLVYNTLFGKNILNESEELWKRQDWNLVSTG